MIRFIMDVFNHELALHQRQCVWIVPFLIYASVLILRSPRRVEVIGVLSGKLVVVEPQVEARINRVCPARSGRGGERPLDLQGSALCRLAGRALPLGVVPVPGAAGCCDIPLEALGLIRTGQIRRSPEQGAPLKNG
jgi:hypothetical protein